MSTELNPEGPPEILQLIVVERVTPEGASVARLVDQLAFGVHPDIDDIDGVVGVHTAAARSSQQFRIVFDELLVGNYLEEIACSDGSFSRIPLGTTPDDIAACSGGRDSVTANCVGEYAVCLDADGNPLCASDNHACGILDEIGYSDDPDGAADDFRLIDGVITITCDGEEMAYDTQQSFYQPSGNQLVTAGPMGIDSLGPALVIVPSEGLRTSASCQLAFDSTIVDKDGNQVCARADSSGQYDPVADCPAGDLSGISFSVEPLRVTAHTPADGAANVVRTANSSLDATITVQFNANIDDTTIGGITLDYGSGVIPACGDPEVPPCARHAANTTDATLVYVTAVGGYPTEATVTVTTPTTITDVFGGALPEPYVFSFGVEPLRVRSNTPVADATDVAPTATGSADSEVEIVFNADINPATLGAITLNDGTINLPICGEPAVPPCITLATTPATAPPSFSPSAVTITAVAGLATATEYTVQVPTSVADVYTHTLAAAHQFSFTSAALAVVSTSPADDATAVALGAPIEITFNADLDPATIENITVNDGVGDLAICGAPAVPPCVTITHTPGTKTVTITAEGGLAVSTSYTVTVPTTVTDQFGVALSAQYTFNFETAGS